MGELIRKRGRPRTGRNKTGFCGVRLTEYENEILEYLVRVKCKNRSDILIDGLKMLYDIDQSQRVDDYVYYDDYYEDDDFDDFED